jgi:hypothetical protein
MEKWIELSPEVMFFSSKLKCTSNIQDFPDMNFISTNRTMNVELDNKCIVAVDNWRSLRIGNILMNAKSKRLMIVGLACDGLDIDFDWSVEGPVDSITSEITCSGKINDVYRVYNKIYPFPVMTKVRIECRTLSCNVDIMVGCLAYFWTHYELNRIDS